MAVMALEERPLHDYYPVQCEGVWYQQRTHSVKSFGFNSFIPKLNGFSLDDLRQLPGFHYSYSIESPSSGHGSRQYLLTSSNDIMDDSYGNLIPTFFKGKVGEQIMRIILMEFLRRTHNSLEIDNFSFLKKDNSPDSKTDVVAESKNYLAVFDSRYNVVIFSKDDLSSPLSEFDGIMQYEVGVEDRNKGLLICEAKTQGLGNYSKVISAEGTARVEKMLIRPFRELYPNHSLDFLLMGSKPYLFDPVSERRLRSNLIRLNELLNENEMGMIPFYFVDTKAKMDEVAESMVNMHKAIGKKKVMLDEMFTSEQDRIWFENHDFLYMIKGRRFEKILQKSNGVYRLVYSLK